MFHELATNAGKYGAFSRRADCCRCHGPSAATVLDHTWDETEGPSIGKVSAAGFGTKLLKSALSAFDGKTEVSYLATGLHCNHAMPHPAKRLDPVQEKQHRAPRSRFRKRR